MSRRTSRQGLGWRYIRGMRIALILASVLAASSASAQDMEAQRAVNAMRDMARAQQSTARSLERMERRDRDRARDEDRARRNAEVFSRSNRRFD